MITWEVLPLSDLCFCCSTVVSKFSITSRKKATDESADGKTSKQTIIDPSCIEFMSTCSDKNDSVRVSASWTEGISSPCIFTFNGTVPKWTNEDIYWKRYNVFI